MKCFVVKQLVMISSEMFFPVSELQRGELINFLNYYYLKDLCLPCSLKYLISVSTNNSTHVQIQCCVSVLQRDKKVFWLPSRTVASATRQDRLSPSQKLCQSIAASMGKQVLVSPNTCNAFILY